MHLDPLFELPAVSPDPALTIVPGQLVDTDRGRWGLATAVFSPCRAYRYQLSRVWDAAAPRVNFLMLNPSTADAFVLDPTVRRCVGFAQAWGAGSLTVTNCFALRSTDPAGLRAVADPVGPDNDASIVSAATAADTVIAAWGVHATYLDRERHVRELLRTADVTLHTLRLTKHGHPGHPLYLPGTSEPVAW